jgi:Kef-type K+ transport system membrane component KefB
MVDSRRLRRLYGEVGLMLLVLEAGLDVDLPMLRLIGLRGVGVAVTGSLAPLGIAAFLGIYVLGLDWRAALAVGCTLAPTSMGIALNVLKKGKVRAHPHPADPYPPASAMDRHPPISHPASFVPLAVARSPQVLNTPTGQLIIAAAVLDDVIALILLAELQVLGLT